MRHVKSGGGLTTPPNKYSIYCKKDLILSNAIKFAKAATDTLHTSFVALLRLHRTVQLVQSVLQQLSTQISTTADITMNVTVCISRNKCKHTY